MTQPIVRQVTYRSCGSDDLILLANINVSGQLLDRWFSIKFVDNAALAKVPLIFSYWYLFIYLLILRTSIYFGVILAPFILRLSFAFITIIKPS